MLGLRSSKRTDGRRAQTSGLEADELLKCYIACEDGVSRFKGDNYSYSNNRSGTLSEGERIIVAS